MTLTRTKLLSWLGGAALTALVGYLVQDAWAAIGKVPILESKFQAVDQRLERIEDSLDLLLRFQLRRYSDAGGTIVMCKDARGRVAPCDEEN